MSMRAPLAGLLALALFPVLSGDRAMGAPATQPDAPDAPAAVQDSIAPDFTYQGRLTDGDSPASGTHDFQIALFDAHVAGNQVSGTINREDVLVEDGMFTLPLSFGSVFHGVALWLEFEVRAGDSDGDYTTLAPRQPLTAAPYAHYALRSGGSWNLGGNATIAGQNFLGTTTNQPLVIMTNAVEVIRVDTAGRVGIGVNAPGAKLEVQGALGDIGLMATGDSRAIIGRIGAISCPGSYAVGGCAGPGSNIGVSGNSGSGYGVYGSSTSGRGVLGNAPNGIGVHGESSSRGVVGTLNNANCAGSFAVGGCAGSALAVGVYGQSTGTAAMWAQTETGDLFVGVVGAGEARRARIDVNGRGFFNGGTQTGGADYAESIRATDDVETLEPGDVLEIDPNEGYAVRRSREAASLLVAGVYSTRPSILAVGEHGIDDPRVGEVPMALLGVVPTKASAENGSIAIGDLLVTASLPGHAMKAVPQMVAGVAIYPTGAILGKALEPLAKGTGLIKVMVTLR